MTERYKVAKSRISSARALFAEEAQKFNQEYPTKPSENTFSKLAMVILGDMLTQAALTDSWYCVTSVSLSYEKTANYCVYQVSSEVNTHDVSVNLTFTEAENVVEDVKLMFLKMDDFCAYHENNSTRWTFMMKV